MAISSEPESKTGATTKRPPRRKRQSFNKSRITETLGEEGIFPEHELHWQKPASDVEDKYGEKTPNPEDHELFAHFEEMALEILDATQEPIAIFGSLALYMDNRSGNIPQDIDIVTTPAGVQEIFRSLQNKPGIEFSSDGLSIHNPKGPLKALRLSGRLLHKDKAIAFEIFGEGGEFEGEHYRGLFRFGDNPEQATQVISGKIIETKSLLAAYQKLIGHVREKMSEVQDKLPKESEILSKWETRVKELERKLHKTGIFDREELLGTLRALTIKFPTLRFDY